MQLLELLFYVFFIFVFLMYVCSILSRGTAARYMHSLYSTLGPSLPPQYHAVPLAVLSRPGQVIPVEGVTPIFQYLHSTKSRLFQHIPCRLLTPPQRAQPCSTIAL
jgi:hypothetical protein